MEMEDSLAVDLARRDLEREASERYKGFVVRTRLKRVSKETRSCVRKKHEGFPIGTSSSSSCRMGTRYSRIVRCTGPIGRIPVITLPVILTSRFRSFAAI